MRWITLRLTWNDVPRYLMEDHVLVMSVRVPVRTWCWDPAERRP